jgi:tetratricopeptide (TPR) repeat protein
MKMKHSIVMVAAVTLSVSVSAQSLEQGIKMYNYERYESAKKELSGLAANDPIANYYYGLSELNLGNVDAAKNIFARFPDSYANRAGMARVAFAQGKTTEGQQLAQGIAATAKKKDWEPLKYAAEATTYSDGSDKQMAVDWWTEAMKRNNNDPSMLIPLGDAYQELSSAAGGKAMSSYEKAVDLDTKNKSLAYSRIGKLWYDAKRYDLALENWRKAQEADPTNPIPYRDLANAYYWTGKYDLARQNIEKYLELSDKTVDDKIMYGNILYLSKDYTNAISKMQELLKSGVERPGFYGVLAYSQYEIKDSVNALNNVRTYFAKQNPKKIYPMDIMNYGKIALQNGMADSADFYFNKAVAADTAKNKAATYRLIAESLKDAKSYANAAKWYGKIIAENPAADAIDYFWWGTMYYYAQNYTEAAKAFEQMEKQHPSQPSATYWRGRVAAAIDNEGKQGTAVPFFTKWLETVGPTYDKKNDLMTAYQYMALYSYNQSDNANTTKYLTMIEGIDPNNSLAKQLRDIMKKK